MRTRVLVVDDDETVRVFLAHVLDKSGFQVLVASDGREALDICRSNPVDLMVTDIFMPEQDGLETIMTIRRDFPEVRIIAISGGGYRCSGDYLAFAGKLGAQRTLAKPFGPEEILAAVREVMEQAPPPA